MSQRNRSLENVVAFETNGRKTKENEDRDCQTAGPTLV